MCIFIQVIGARKWSSLDRAMWKRKSEKKDKKSSEQATGKGQRTRKILVRKWVAQTLYAAYLQCRPLAAGPGWPQVFSSNRRSAPSHPFPTSDHPTGWPDAKCDQSLVGYFIRQRPTTTWATPTLRLPDSVCSGVQVSNAVSDATSSRYPRRRRTRHPPKSPSPNNGEGEVILSWWFCP
ncbi:hypothetical protein F4778DRAFT_501308 [Xylariomycetidae sp. FL2044]|nr:hypothetical protein F4778DRAFT_501308 [Xylariomycetidae sp. FL2044]